MVRVNNNISKLFIITLFILTFIQLSDSRRRYGWSSRGGSGFIHLFQYLFGSSKSTSYNTGASKPEPVESNAHSNSPIGWIVDEPKGWRDFPGGVKPPAGAPLPYIQTYDSNSSNADPNSAQPLPGYQSVGGYGPPPPPPPPGFLNSPQTSGAAPSYTYNINSFYSRDASNNNLLASFAMWELIKHRSNYNVFTANKHNNYKSIVKVAENSTLEPGNFYIVAPNNVECSAFVYDLDNYYFLIECDISSDINLTVIFPNNKTSIIGCKTHIVGRSICDNTLTIIKDELTPVKYEVFNETKVYGEPLCNTTVVDGMLAVNNATELNNSTACVYPPYKWTGKNWTTIYEEEKKEKIKQNLNSVYNLTNLENDTLGALSRATYFGKLYDLLTINKN